MKKEQKQTIIVIVAVLAIIILYRQFGGLMSIYRPDFINDFDPGTSTFSILTTDSILCPMSSTYFSKYSFSNNYWTGYGPAMPNYTSTGLEITATPFSSVTDCGKANANINSKTTLTGKDFIIQVDCAGQGCCQGIFEYQAECTIKVGNLTSTFTDLTNYDVVWNGTKYDLFRNGVYLDTSNYANPGITLSNTYCFTPACTYDYSPTILKVNDIRYKTAGTSSGNNPGYYYNSTSNTCKFQEVTSGYNSSFTKIYNDCYNLIQPVSYSGYRFSAVLNTCTSGSVSSKTSPYNSTFIQSLTDCQGLLNQFAGDKVRSFSLPNYRISPGASKNYEIIIDVERIKSGTTSTFTFNMTANSTAGSTNKLFEFTVTKN